MKDMSADSYNEKETPVLKWCARPGKPEAYRNG